MPPTASSSSVLSRLASQAARVFAPPPSSLSSSTVLPLDHLPNLVASTRSLLLLSKAPGSTQGDAHLRQCVQQCTEHSLAALERLPASADVSPDIAIILLGVLRASAAFWDREKCGQLARLLNDRIDAVALRTWRPRVLLAAVHAIAKACPAQAHLPLVGDAVALLHHHEAQLSERDVATLLWCLAVTRLAADHERVWASLCKRAVLLFSRMNGVSRLTLSQALLLQRDCLCESQAELLRVVHQTNREMAQDGEDSGELRNALREGEWERPRRSARFHAEVNAVRRTPAAAATVLTSQLLQHTTHSLSDEALVRLLLSLLASGADARDELPLVLAHLGERRSLTEQLCVEVLRCLQPHAMVTEGHGGGDAATAQPLMGARREAELARHTRHRVAQLLVQKARSTAPLLTPGDVAEVLCVEHHLSADVAVQQQQHSSSSGSSTSDAARESSRVASSPVNREALWSAVLSAFAASWDGAAQRLQQLDGAALWRQQCVRAYVMTVLENAPAAPAALSPQHAAVSRGLTRLAALADAAEAWPDVRERRSECAKVAVAAAGAGATAVLCLAHESHRTAALSLLASCAAELGAGAAHLSVATTLRLLASLDTCDTPAVREVLGAVQPALSAQLDTHTARTAGILPDVIQFISNALAGSLSGAAVAGRGRAAVSDAVLDVFIRLLVQERQPRLSSVQSRLLVRCLQERQRQPAALERAFMMLLTRRLGQSAALLRTAALPTDALCDVIELASGLPRPLGDATAAATRTVIVSTLLDLLVEHSIPAAQSAEQLVAAGLLLRLDIMDEFQRTREVAAVLERRGMELLQSPHGAVWTPEQKAYLVAALVCAQRTPSAELLSVLPKGGGTV